MTTTLTTVATTVYGGQAFMAYQLSDLFGTQFMVFYGSMAADKINIPIVDGSAAVDLADGGDHTTAGTASMTGTDIPVFTPVKAKSMVAQDQIDLRPDLQIMTRVGRVHGTRVGLGKTLRIMNTLIDNAETAVNETITNYSGASDVGAAVDADIKALAAAWDEAGIPPMGRHIMLKSDLFYELPAVRAIFGQEFGGQAAAQTVSLNFTIRYLNFFIHNGPIGFGTDYSGGGFSTFPTNIDLSNVRALIWHEDAWALRHQVELRTSFGWVEHKQSYLVMSRIHMGWVVLQSAGLHIFKQT